MSTNLSLFNTYLTILSLASFPSHRANSSLSSLHGLITNNGNTNLSTQSWVWLVGPLWSSWSSWFNALAAVFVAGGVCFVSGLPSTELAGKALTWLTLGEAYRGLSLSCSPLPQANLNNNPSLAFPTNAFWLVAKTPSSFHSFGAPSFSLSGGNISGRVGWAVLPGLPNNNILGSFLLLAALVAYRNSSQA